MWNGGWNGSVVIAKPMPAPGVVWDNSSVAGRPMPVQFPDLAPVTAPPDAVPGNDNGSAKAPDAMEAP